MSPKLDSCQSKNDFMSAKCISCRQNIFMSPKMFFMSPKTEFHVAKLISCHRDSPLSGCLYADIRQKFVYFTSKKTISVSAPNADLSVLIGTNILLTKKRGTKLFFALLFFLSPLIPRKTEGLRTGSK